MTGEPIHYEQTLDLRPLTKEKPMPDHSDPSNSSVKPSIETLEGKLTAVFTLLTALAASLGVVASAYPQNPHVQVACLVVASILAALGTFVTVNHTNKRSVLKGQVAEAAAAFAIEKLRSDAAPAAIELLKSAGVGASLPK